MNNNEFNATVISIPEDSAPKAEPRIFRPVKAFKTKLYIFVLSGLLITVLFYIGMGIVTYFISQTANDPNSFFWDFHTLFFPITLGMTLLWLIPSLILIPLYVNGITYQVHGTEIVVFKGIINKTEKHVPFRTITNISSRVGPLDRLLGIGCIFIETAGKAGMSDEPEEKIEGIRVYKEVRDFILKELRKFKAPYTTGTEIEGKSQSIELADKDPTQARLDVLINEIKEIKEILRNGVRK
ncbi:MAG: PH domain-containing protein [Promethearchaeota archaeon]